MTCEVTAHHLVLTEDDAERFRLGGKGGLMVGADGDVVLVGFDDRRHALG